MRVDTQEHTCEQTHESTGERAHTHTREHTYVSQHMRVQARTHTHTHMRAHIWEQTHVQHFSIQTHDRTLPSRHSNTSFSQDSVDSEARPKSNHMHSVKTSHPNQLGGPLFDHRLEKSVSAPVPIQPRLDPPERVLDPEPGAVPP